MTVCILQLELDAERRRQQNRESAQRRRARARGEDIPARKPGPSKGFRFSANDLAKRKYARGDKHPQWTGDAVSEKAGRKRALKLYPVIGPCRCGADKAERHHKDGDTANNVPSNIEPLCRRCHMEEDGRLASVKANPGRGSACR